MGRIGHWKTHVKEELFSADVIEAVLSSLLIEQLCRAADYRWRQSFWSPTFTVMTFLLQVLDGAKTLRAGVAVLLTQLVARGESQLPSAEPGAYCQARKRLPLEVLRDLLGHVADDLGTRVSSATGWLGHRVWVVDGSNASMPDTPELQKAFPQHCQKKGCGFPMAQFVGLFCWTTGAVVDVIIDSMTPHELTLYRKLWHHFKEGDVVLADRAFGSFVDVVRLRQFGVFGVFRLHQRRKVDFRKGKRLGKDDTLQIWLKPQQWRESMGISEKEFQALPTELPVRLIRISKAPRGFRSRTIVLVTTLLDPVAFPAEDIRNLYRDRWMAELNLRSLKTELGMEILRGMSPDVVKKEITMHLIAYNLIRLLMWEAARQHGRDLHRLSFTGTLHRIRAVFPILLLHAIRDALRCAVLFEQLLRWIAADRVPHRPDRIEPRRVKRRPKTYSRLTSPRAFYKKRNNGIDKDAR